MQADFKTSAPRHDANVRDCGAVGDGVTDDTLSASDTDPWIVQNAEVSWSGLRR